MRPGPADSVRSDAWLVRVARGYWLPANPLRRHLDKLESTFVMMAVVLGLLTVPLAASVGEVVTDTSYRTAATLRATGHPVTVRTLEAADSVAYTDGAATTSVKVAWDDPAGVRHRGVAMVDVGAKSGTKLTLWSDARGTLQRTPPSSVQSASLGFGAGVLFLLGVWVALGVAWRLLRWDLDRRRYQLWESEWQRVAPFWTGHHS